MQRSSPLDTNEPSKSPKLATNSPKLADVDEKSDDHSIGVSAHDPPIGQDDRDAESENDRKGLVTPPPPTSGAGGEKKKKSHPLAALQMLCDKTEKKSNSGSGQGSKKGS